MTDADDVRRATVHDVARTAGVSLATVDRVLNGRPGVRPATAAKVEAAIKQLDFRRDLSASLLARSRDLRVLFLIPDGENEFMSNLGAAIQRRSRGAMAERIEVGANAYTALSARALADRIDELDPKTCDCAVVVAPDDDYVRSAIDAAVRRGVTVITLVSDLPGSSRRLFIGIDNAAAGRTAASLMGRFCGDGGRVGVIAGSLGLRDHRERLDGFRAVLLREFPKLEIIGPLEGRDDASETAACTQILLDRYPDLAGIYNLGAGNAGLISALEGRNGSGVRVIVHELSEPTRAGLKSGVVDVVLDQNPEGEIRAAIAAARAVAMGASRPIDSEPIEIGIFLRDNLH